MTAEPIRRSSIPVTDLAPVLPRAARRRSYRPFAPRRVGASTVQRVAASAAPPLTDLERQRRVDRVAAFLVRTMRACPAPGIAPLTTRDWLVISGAVLLPYLAVFALAAAASVH